MILEKSQANSTEQDSKRGYGRLWMPVLLWMIAIFVFSSQSALGGIPGPPWIQAVRKSGHIFEYALLALLIGRALVGTWMLTGMLPSRVMWQRAWRLGVLVCTLYAATDEFHQSFVPRRGPHLEDILLDALSATAALGIWYIVRVHRVRTHNSQMERE